MYLTLQVPNFVITVPVSMGVLAANGARTPANTMLIVLANCLLIRVIPCLIC